MDPEQFVNMDRTETHVQEGTDDLLLLQGAPVHRRPLFLKEALNQIRPALWFLHILPGFNTG